MVMATDTEEECPSMKLNGQPIEVEEKFWYLGATIEAREE